MSGLVTFIKVLFAALKQTQPKTNRAKGSANKTNCLRKQQQTTMLTGIPKLGRDKGYRKQVATGSTNQLQRHATTSG